MAHLNMEKLPILYNGNFVAMETYTTFFGSMHFFLQITSDRSKPYIYIHFEKNLLRIDDFIFLKSRTSTRRLITEAPFYKERFATNQKSLRLPVQKLWLKMHCVIPHKYPRPFASNLYGINPWHGALSYT